MFVPNNELKSIQITTQIIMGRLSLSSACGKYGGNDVL